eukprot:SAG31_NODE_2195_length_6220_cov_9.014703_5_plen_176_part_00
MGTPSSSDTRTADNPTTLQTRRAIEGRDVLASGRAGGRAGGRGARMGIGVGAGGGCTTSKAIRWCWCWCWCWWGGVTAKRSPSTAAPSEQRVEELLDLLLGGGRRLAIFVRHVRAAGRPWAALTSRCGAAGGSATTAPSSASHPAADVSLIRLAVAPASAPCLPLGCCCWRRAGT